MCSSTESVPKLFCKHKLQIIQMMYVYVYEWIEIMLNYPSSSACFNTLRLRQNGRHFADNIFKCIVLNENVWIVIKISLKFVPKGPNNNIPAFSLDNGLVPSRQQAIIWNKDD